MMHPVVLRGGRPAFASVLVLLLLIFHPAMARAANYLPTISGTPPTTVQAGTPYAFQPTATDANGDTLRFIDLLIVGSMTVGEICRTLGDYSKARDLFRQALAHIEPGFEMDRLGRVGLPAVRARGHLAWTLAELGDFAAARE